MVMGRGCVIGYTGLIMYYGICVHCNRKIKDTDLECYDEEECILYQALNEKDWE